MSFAYQFWKRVDIQLSEKKLGLNDLSEKTQISYASIRGWRSKDRVPGAEDLLKIATTLKVSVDYLLAGSDASTSILSPEAKAVEESPELQALVRAVMRDPQLLSALAAVIESSERANIG